MNTPLALNSCWFMYNKEINCGHWIIYSKTTHGKFIKCAVQELVVLKTLGCKRTSECLWQGHKMITYFNGWRISSELPFCFFVPTYLSYQSNVCVLNKDTTLSFLEFAISSCEVQRLRCKIMSSTNVLTDHFDSKTLKYLPNNGIKKGVEFFFVSLGCYKSSK